MRKYFSHFWAMCVCGWVWICFLFPSHSPGIKQGTNFWSPNVYQSLCCLPSQGALPHPHNARDLLREGERVHWGCQSPTLNTAWWDQQQLLWLSMLLSSGESRTFWKHGRLWAGQLAEPTAAEACTPRLSCPWGCSQTLTPSPVLDLPQFLVL